MDSPSEQPAPGLLEGSGRVSPSWALPGGAVLLAAAAFGVYLNSLETPFVFDDIPSIIENASIRSLWPPSGPLSPPNSFGYTVSGRPLLNLTLAINYALSGTAPWSYHVLNVLVHALSSLALFGLVRRSLLKPAAGMRLGKLALPTAWVVALLFAVHPLQTEAVTFVVQRAESLMALFYLLTLYCFARAEVAKSKSLWLAGSVVACFLGIGCKEVIVTAPVVVLLYDRAFAAGSFGEALRRRRWYYASLAASWVPLVWLVLEAGGNRGGTFDFSPSAFWNYWLVQLEALSIYLRLSVFPHPLCFDYGVFRVHDFQALAPHAILTLGALALSAWTLLRRPALGFLGAAFFLVLSPTSLLPGINQVIVEHRMYLPLAAVLAFAVCVGAHYAGKRALVAGVLLAAAAGWATVERNEDYRTDLALWEDTVAKRPGSVIAQDNLGATLLKLGRLEEALRRFDTALEINPKSPYSRYNRGLALMKLERIDDARKEFEAAVAIQPRYAQARGMLANVLLKLNRPDEARKELELALSAQPEAPDLLNTLGQLQAAKRNWREAIDAYRRALGFRPDYAEAEFNLGMALLGAGNFREAMGHLERAVSLDPEQASPHFNLGVILQRLGRGEEAIGHYRETLRLKPDHVEARLNLGSLLGTQGKIGEAREQFQEAVRLAPRMPEAHVNLGFALAQSGRFAEAVASYERALALRPGYPMAHFRLGNALLALNRPAEARLHFGEAVRLAPDFQAAKDSFERLGNNH